MPVLRGDPSPKFQLNDVGLPVVKFEKETVSELAVLEKLAVGAMECVMLTVSEEGGQTPLEIVQTKVLVPILRPATVGFEIFGSETLPLPTSVLQVPEPIPGMFPERVENVSQAIASIPASAGVGISSRVMVTVSAEDGHTPLEMVHEKELLPVPMPAKAEVGLPGVAAEPLPVIIAQFPEPTEGVFAAKVEASAQST